MAGGFATRRMLLHLLHCGRETLEAGAIAGRECLRLVSLRVAPALYRSSSRSSFPNRAPPSPSTRSSILHRNPSSPSEEVETVFSDAVKSMVPDAPSRKALLELKRFLSSEQSPADFDSALSCHSSLLLKPQPWLFFLDILRRGPNSAQAIQVFEWKLRQPNVTFTPQEYALIIRAAGKIGMLEKAKTLYQGMPSRGVHRTVDVENAYMYAHAYDAEENDCVEALNVFQRLRNSTSDDCKPNLTSYNTALSCYSKLRHLQHLEKTFDEMVGAGCSPSVETYNCLMLAYRRLGIWWRMEEIFCMMQETSRKPNALTFRTLIRGYAAAGLLERMEKAREAMLKHGHPMRASTAEAVIAAYKKAGEFAKMEKILFSIKARGFQRNMSKLMLRSHAHNERMQSMEALVDELMRSGDVAFSPELAVIVIKAYFNKGEHERIENFLEAAHRCGWNLNRAFYNTLIFLYAKHGRFAEMEWYFETMQSSGCQPNFRTFQIMFRAYKKGNMDEAAQEVLREMEAMGFVQK